MLRIAHARIHGSIVHIHLLCILQEGSTAMIKDIIYALWYNPSIAMKIAWIMSLIITIILSVRITRSKNRHAEIVRLKKLLLRERVHHTQELKRINAKLSVYRDVAVTHTVYNLFRFADTESERMVRHG